MSKVKPLPALDTAADYTPLRFCFDFYLLPRIALFPAPCRDLHGLRQTFVVGPQSWSLWQHSLWLNCNHDHALLRQTKLLLPWHSTQQRKRPPWLLDDTCEDVAKNGTASPMPMPIPMPMPMPVPMPVLIMILVQPRKLQGCSVAAQQAKQVEIKIKITHRNSNSEILQIMRDSLLK